MAQIQAIRGFNDILPAETPRWQALERLLQQIVESYGYSEIRFPILERTELFQRGVGEVTDIVAKEMFSFADRDDDSLSLRPEGTASCVRVGIEHGLFYNQTQKLWYRGPMFRYERPQKGRYRQFHQFGVEAFGFADIDIEAELIALSYRFWRALGLSEGMQLELNTLGDQADRAQYRALLVAYFERHYSLLDEDSRKRLVANPLRILDSKNPDLQALIADAPKLLHSLSDASRSRFERLQQVLREAQVPFRINPRLVRGLDYYSHTVFEWVSEHLGAQSTFCAGGRCDSLVPQLGGKDCPAVGFAIGLERLLLLLEAVGKAATPVCAPQAYLIVAGDLAQAQAAAWAERLRDALPGLRLQLNLGGGSLKKQMQRADKSGADYALVLGEAELAAQVLTCRSLRTESPQQSLNFEAVRDLLRPLTEQGV